MKPRPLDLKIRNLIPFKEKERLMIKISNEGHSFPHYTTCKTCEDDFEEVVNFVLKFVKRRIKEACEFYLRYKDKPECLWEEKPEYRETLKKMFVFYKENGEPYFSEDDYGWEIYNDWLFKLAFKEVFEEEK
ncbi:MAG: hypothetical protein ACXQTS_05350 [Candidatus Methanospirareceae archaeon]